MKPLGKKKLIETLGVPESGMPDALAHAKSAMVFRGESFRARREALSPALLWLEMSAQTTSALEEAWPRFEALVTEVLLSLVNIGESSEQLDAFRRAFRDVITRPEPWDIAKLSDYELRELRKDLRSFWGELQKERMPGTGREGRSGEFGDSSKVSIILHKLWHGLGNDDLNADRYWISWETGRFFPRQKNFRGVVAQILFKKRRYLAICPNCGRYFIKRRDDQKNCLADECQRRANNERQQKFQNAKKVAHKSIRGK